MLLRKYSGLVIAALAAACGSGGDAGTGSDLVPSEAAAPGPGPDSSSSDASSGPPGSSGSGATDAGGADGSAAAPAIVRSCKDIAPAGAPRSAPLPVYAGACPALAAPPAFTTITSSATQRTFLVYRPSTTSPGERLPVVFLFHWLGGSPEDMASKLEVQAAVNARRFIAIIPAPKGDGLFRWPFEASQTQGRVDEEARFFDDMLACVGSALPAADKECVSSVGVSAGALWTAQLATLRSERLASMVVLSGGVGGVVRNWTTTAHRLPALVLWGGSKDMYPANVPIMNFETASHDLIAALASDGHYLLECAHNCGHAVPPFDVPAAGSGGLLFDPVWRFVLDHPYGLGPSSSPYAGKPLPSAFPSWCGQGKGSATPRPAAAACN